jgi:soluble lytic murein transglycosylase-like protein
MISALLFSIVIFGLGLILLLSRSQELHNSMHPALETTDDNAPRLVRLVDIERVMPPRKAEANISFKSTPDIVDAESWNQLTAESVPVTGRCLPISSADLARWIDQAASKYRVSQALILTVMFQESRFNPCAVSAKGAAGMMQLMPETINQFALSDPFDPQQNINTGARLLKTLFVRYHGDFRKTIAAYNAGTAAVDRASSGIPNFAETIDFVRSIEPIRHLVEDRSTSR